MSNGTYEEFRDALRAFESGWDRDRYDAGIIQDWQLDQWAGGPAGSFFPQYSSWSELTDAEWDAMSYQSMNSLGFVGYQFGEALLIDLGYYDDDVFYGNGASTNTWDGEWTDKNGVNSLEDFMTAQAQEVAIQEAFGYNLKVIQDGLAANGESLDDYIGTTRSFMQNGVEVQVELTLTGIMAASHLRGAWGTLALLQAGDVSTDEYGTSILQYIDQFGGYDAPTVDEAIEFFESRLTGDEGLGTPGGGTGGGETGGGETGGGQGGGGSQGNGSAGVTKNSADVVVTWSWGSSATITGFDPASGTIFIDWIGADALEVSEVNGSTVFAIPSNNQTLTLDGVALADLSDANFTILDDTAAAEVLGLVGSGSGGSGGGTGGGGHGGHTGTMVTVSLTSPDQTIPDFDPLTDMVHVEGGVTGDRFEIFEESGDALGLTVRIVVTEPDGTVLSTTILQGVGLIDLTLANFSIAEQSALNEVTAALGETIEAPGPEGGYILQYDADGSNPPVITGATAEGGLKYRADTNADDITGFDPAADQLDFGGTSVHGMIVTKSALGEVVIDSPWSPAAQIVQGVTFQDLSIESFGVVGNEHLRQDLGGVVSWELGIGPREADTVYIRSHEYGQHEVIDGFDPASMKISFLYFGTRERLSVTDTEDGLVISSLPTGQSFTFTGVELADLAPGRVEFHHDQVMEDNLEVPFGFAQDDVTLVDRTMLLTPEAPAGATTDGHQVRDGVMTPPGGTGGGETGGGETGGGETGGGQAGNGPDTTVITWNWAAEETISGFDPGEDVIDFSSLGANDFAIREEDDDLVIEVLNNGGHTYTFENVQAEDLSAANLDANPHNTVLDDQGGVYDQLNALGFDDPLI